MSEPELEFEIDEFGCIRYRVTNEGALLSKDEKEFIIDYVTRMQTENAKLRELVRWMYDCMDESCAVQHPYAPAPISYDHLMQALARARELGVEVSE